MGKDQVMFKIGELVFAKVRGYPPWPARITSIIDGRPNNFKYGVHFFGTSETAAVFHKDICSYKENKERLAKPGKRRFFKEGLEEIEQEMREIEEKEETLDFLPDGSPVIVPRDTKRFKNNSDGSDDDSEEAKFKQNKIGDNSGLSGNGNLGSSVENSNKGVKREKLGKGGIKDKGKKTEKRDKPEKVEKKDKGKKVEKMDKGEKVVKRNTAEKVGKKDKGEKVGKKNTAEKAGKMDKGEKVEKRTSDEKVGEKDVTENVENRDAAEKAGKMDKGESVEKRTSDEKVGEKDVAENVENRDTTEKVGKEQNKGKAVKGQKRGKVEKGTKGTKRVREEQVQRVEGVEKANKTVRSQRGKNQRRSKAEVVEVPTRLEQTSRSGRVIKPKRFLDDEDADEDKSKIKPSTSGASKKEKLLMKRRGNKELFKATTSNVLGQDMGRIMWAKTKCGQMVQIKLDIDRPAMFKDERSRLMWERATEINAKRLKAEIEAGEITREDIKLQLRPTEEQKAKLSAKELFEMKRLRIIERKRGKLRWLKLETRLVDIDVLIKTCLQKSKADIEKALSLMDELINMPLDPLMLKKHPQVVDTTKKLRQYIGNASEWNYTEDEAEAFEALALKVRQKANSLFNKYTSLFAVPETSNFWSFFLEAVSEFSKLTQDMSRERVFGLIIDPSSPYFKDVCEDDKEEEEFKLKYNISADKYIAKRKARQGAGKR